MSEQRYVHVKDDSAHDYIVPVERESDWYEWVEDEESWDAPPWARRVGPFTFTDPREDGRPVFPKEEASENP